MTNVKERLTVKPRLIRVHSDSSRLALGRLTNLGPAERIRFGDMIDAGHIAFSDQPVMLDGDTLGARKRQLRGWMMSAGTPQPVAEAVASRLRIQVNYVRYLVTAKSRILLVEHKDR